MWLKYVQHIGNMNKLRAAGFFRAYAYTNQAELFACMVEAFFESPVKFNEKHPVLFRIMSLLLNQHPLKMK
jgi:Mlc titration factor MtfA (ptsG expression regulator)